MFSKVLGFIEQLNFSYPQSILGAHFWEIIALLSIIFGGSFLLFGYQHHKYFLGITGLLVGGWVGLMLKNVLSSNGTILPFIYMAVCATLGCLLAIFFERMIGILLGGFLTACFAIIFFPTLFKSGHETYIALSLFFLFGGGLGAIFPRFFFIINASLIGSVFVTYGVSMVVLHGFLPDASSYTQILLHLLVFVPFFIFGIIYQLRTSPSDSAKSKKAEPVKA